jgi:multidrug efflux pump subunit AcrA (membrane-fusion protein)
MKNLNKKILSIAIAIIGIGAWYFLSGDDEQQKEIIAKVTKGNLSIDISCTGELLSEENKNIMGPRNLQEFRIWNIKIADIIQEGTFVKKGDYIAQLDNSSVMGKMKDLQENIDKMNLELKSAKLDTTLDLKAARNDLVNKQYALEEEKIKLKESIYESPATIRQIEISYDKIKRSYAQQQENYKLKKVKAQSKISKIIMNLSRAQRDLGKIRKLMSSLRIMAPEQGMLIYANRRGQKIEKDAQIDAWFPLIATLPDLSNLISKTFVNEIDISKVKVGQKVKIGIDAFPGKFYKGKVTKVANIGEKLSGEVAKVFEVIVKVDGSDKILKPAMTTSNKIHIKKFKDILKIPLEALHSDKKINYVFLKSSMGIEKVAVKVGQTNNEEIIIKEGLQEGDEVLLNIPSNADEMEIEKV